MEVNFKQENNFPVWKYLFQNGKKANSYVCVQTLKRLSEKNEVQVKNSWKPWRRFLFSEEYFLLFYWCESPEPWSVKPAFNFEKAAFTFIISLL